MKILFAYTNINGFHADSFGDGIAQIMAVTKKAGHNVRQIQIFNKDEYPQLDSAVKEFQPDVVGVTSFTVSMVDARMVATVARKIVPHAHICLGGHHPIAFPREAAQIPEFDSIVVGEGETDIFNSSSRRREGFMYTIGEDKIVNINSLLPCYEADGETRFKYTVAEAKAINNNNEIFGVATKTVEKTDSFGNVVLDVDGNIEYESVAVAVKLTPTSGSVEECPAQEIEEYERQSSSFPWYTLLLLPLAAMRRVFRK